jgi:hypothetical protein
MDRTPIEEVEVSENMQRRILPNGKRTIKLRADERAAFREQRLIESAVNLFLDIDTPHTWKQISEELDVSMVKLKEMTKSKEFIETYDAHFADLGSDPRVKVARAQLADLLGTAVNTLEKLMTTPATSDTVKLNAAKEVIRLSGINEMERGVSDKGELAEFLKKANLNIGEMNFNMAPPDFEKSIAQYENGDFIEGQFVTKKNYEVPDEEAEEEDEELDEVS